MNRDSLRLIILRLYHRFDQIPRWSGLNHFINVLKAAGEFTDGTKYEDISKVSQFIMGLALIYSVQTFKLQRSSFMQLPIS